MCADGSPPANKLLFAIKIADCRAISPLMSFMCRWAPPSQWASVDNANSCFLLYFFSKFMCSYGRPPATELPLAIRIAAFRAILSLPDAFRCVVTLICEVTQWLIRIRRFVDVTAHTLSLRVLFICEIHLWSWFSRHFSCRCVDQLLYAYCRDSFVCASHACCSILQYVAVCVVTHLQMLASCVL